MKNKSVVVFFLLVALVFSSVPSYAQEVRDKSDSPTIWQDLRRSEIVTLGSLPFVTIFTTLGFSILNFGVHDIDSLNITNPFARMSTGISQDDQINILLTSLYISAGIGVTDFTVRLIKRSVAKRRAERNRQKAIEIQPVAFDSSAVRLPPPKVFANGIALK